MPTNNKDHDLEDLSPQQLTRIVEDEIFDLSYGDSSIVQSRKENITGSIRALLETTVQKFQKVYGTIYKSSMSSSSSAPESKYTHIHTQFSVHDLQTLLNVTAKRRQVLRDMNDYVKCLTYLADSVQSRELFHEAETLLDFINSLMLQDKENNDMSRNKKARLSLNEEEILKIRINFLSCEWTISKVRSLEFFASVC
jgi:hypothetical protein